MDALRALHESQGRPVGGPVFRSNGHPAELNERIRAVFLAAPEQNFTIRDIMANFNLGNAAANYHITRLRQKRAIVALPGYRYRLNPDTEQTLIIMSQGPRMTKDSWKVMWPIGRAAMGLHEGPDFYTLKSMGNAWQTQIGIDMTIRKWKSGHADARMLSGPYDVTDYDDVAHSRDRVDRSMREQAAR